MSSFWGVEVKPGKPYTLTHGDFVGRLRLTQATLGDEVCKGKKCHGVKRCILQCGLEKKDPVFLCAVMPKQFETCPLELEFEVGVTFSVIGERSIHLTGYHMPDLFEKDRSDSYSDAEDNLGGSKTSCWQAEDEGDGKEHIRNRLELASLKKRKDHEDISSSKRINMTEATVTRENSPEEQTEGGKRLELTSHKRRKDYESSSKRVLKEAAIQSESSCERTEGNLAELAGYNGQSHKKKKDVKLRWKVTQSSSSWAYKEVRRL